MVLWTLAHDRVLTNEARCRRGLALDSDCSRCPNSVEDRLHQIRDCSASIDVWMQLIPPSDPPNSSLYP